MASGGKLVEVSDVTKVYATSDGNVLALDRASFDVRAREFLSIVGPSGSGKSTLAMLIAGLYPVSPGGVTPWWDPPNLEALWSGLP